MIKARLDWERLRMKLQRMPGEIVKAQERVAQRAAETLPERMKSDLRSNAFGVAGNAPSTLARKAGDTPLIDTEAYAESWVGESKRRGDRVSVEMRPEGHEDVAGWLEHGTSTSPARPHIAPFADRVVPEVAATLIEEVLDVLGD